MKEKENTVRIFITRVIPRKGLDLLREQGYHIDIWKEKRELTKDELIAFAKKADAIISAGFVQMDKDFLEECKHLKVISLHKAGYDNVDIDAATRLGIPVGNTPGVLSHATAEVAFLLMIAVARKAFYNYRKILDGNWKFFEPTADLGMELTGKTLGIFGLGKIGFEMAKLSKAAYKMDIIYHNRGRNTAAELKLDAKKVTFEELLEKSDVLSVHTSLSTETKGIFDKATFKKMKPSSIFINTARGAVHNEKDLFEALESATIWGAGLDVTNPEPMEKDNPLLFLPNVAVLPHIGSATSETRNAMSALAARNAIAGLKGEKLIHCVNPEVYDERYH